MAQLLTLKTFIDNRGALTVLDRVVPFEIKRLFYIYGVDESLRGGHRHKTTRQAAICIQGSCTITNHNGAEKEVYHLNTPDKCLILEPNDWHVMHDFTANAILLVLASTAFDPTDYIFDPYE
ncbi:MAG: sugar 3,4-ketoisomerase [Chitinophagaceae bacterium]|jgi:dTDP-4-dehydrorhamnose 3,5-epimerase-like enzyme